MSDYCETRECLNTFGNGDIGTVRVLANGGMEGIVEQQ